jgi:hypothetical protein
MNRRYTVKKLVVATMIACVLLSTLAPSVAAQDLELRVLGRLGGAIGAVLVQGDYAYLGVGPTLVIVDVADPEHLEELGRTKRLPDLIESIAIHGDFAFLACRFAGLYVIDISDVRNPHEVAHMPGVSYSHDLVVREDLNSGRVLAYVAEHDWFRIFDVTTPRSPLLVGGLSKTRWGVALDLLDKDGKRYAYVAARGDHGGVHVLEVTDPANPSLIETVSPSTATYGLTIDQARLFAAGDGGVWVFDLADPAVPVATAHFQMGIARDAAVAGGHLYAAANFQGLIGINLEGASPSLLGPWHIGGGKAVELALLQTEMNDLLAFVSLQHSLVVVNLTDKDRGEISGFYRGLYAWDVDVLRSNAYVVSDGLGLQVVDTSNPFQPALRGMYAQAEQALRVVAVQRLDKRYGFMVGGLDEGLYILDVTDPTAPVLLSRFPVVGAQDVAVRGEYAYLVAHNGLYILNIADPTQPTEIGRADTQVEALAVAVFRETGTQERLVACVLDGWGLKVIDVTDPAHPALLATRDLSWRGQRVVMQGSLAYLALGPGGVKEVDLSEPSRPQDGRCSSYQNANWIWDLAIRDRYLYTAGNAGIQVFDTTKSCRALPVSAIPASDMDGVRGLTIIDDLIYAADTRGGLAVLDYAVPARPAYLPLVLK